MIYDYLYRNGKPIQVNNETKNRFVVDVIIL